MPSSSEEFITILGEHSSSQLRRDRHADERGLALGLRPVRRCSWLQPLQMAPRSSFLLRVFLFRGRILGDSCSFSIVFIQFLIFLPSGCMIFFIAEMLGPPSPRFMIRPFWLQGSKWTTLCARGHGRQRSFSSKSLPKSHNLLL